MTSCKRTRIAGVFLAVVLHMSLLTVSALADDYDLWVNNVQVTEQNAANVLGNGTVSYDAESNTLTLNGANLTQADNWGVIHYSGNPVLTIEVKGNNNITITGNHSGIDATYGSLTMKGDGTLTVSTGDGVCLRGQSVRIESGTYDLTSTGSNVVYAHEDDVIITGTANVTAKGEGSYPTVYAERYVEISGAANVTASAESYDTLNAASKITIKGNAVVNTTSETDCGIYAPGGLDISGDAQVTATGDFQGIQAKGGIDITGGTVNVTATEDAAIYANGCDMHIGGDAVVTCSTDFTGFAVVVGSSSTEANSLTIDGQAKLIATDIDGDGIFTGKDFSVSGSAEVDTISIYSYGAVTFSDNASVTANTGALQSNAICAIGELTISGSGVTVTATSEAEPTSNGATYPVIIGYAGIELSGGAQVDAKGTHSSAIQTVYQSELMISGSGTVVTASTEAADQAGIFGTGAVSISNQAIVDTSNAPTGLYTNASQNITISDSWVYTSEYNSDISISDSVMFEGTTGQVYGNATVPGDVEVPEGKTLNIPADKTLTVPEGATLTNKGTIAVAQQGAVTNNGSIIGDIQNAGTTTNNGIIQGAVTGEGTTNNGGIIQDGDSIQVSTKDAVQKIIDTSVGKTEAVVITLTGDIIGDLSIPVGANVVIDGGNQYKISGIITCDTSANAVYATNLTLKNLTMDGDTYGDGTNDKDWAVFSADQSAQTVNALNLTLENCTVKNYAKKGMYLTNAKTLRVNGCTFENNATVEMNTPNNRGDYTIDLNLVAIRDADISITNTTFKGECGKKAVVKVVQRGVNDGTGATDISGAMASIANFELSGCTFADTTAAADVNLGTAKKNVNTTAENLTGNFPATISGNATAVVVRMPYLNTTDTDSDNTSENTPTLTVPAGRTATKAANGVLTVKPIGNVTVTPTPTPEPEELPFTDVSENLWFYDYVAYVYSNGLMDGTSTTTFEPNANMTRAMVWAILARIDGEEITGSSWATDARAWAMAEGVSDGTDPNGLVTREQFVTMLWRYAGEPASSYSLGAYTDADSVSDWAATAMAWAVENGIITGVTESTLAPQGTATRAQCAAMLMRFVEL